MRCLSTLRCRLFKRAATDLAGDLVFNEFLSALRTMLKIGQNTLSKKLARKLFDYVDLEDSQLVNVGVSDFA